ncbi:MAG TPA: prolyl oligopeptidase family serine peptidase [Ignavibacteriales bacterium]|nr:prolyl oligopeptidase family serine peptidase [Ignavibacteriales bacterium]
MKRLPHLLLFLLIISARTLWAQADNDPFLWLEDVNGTKALNWVKEHNEATVNELKKNPMFDEIYNTAYEVLNSKEKIAYPTFTGKYIYNLWQDEKNERGLWRRTTLEEYLSADPRWEVLLDIDSLSRAEGVPWVYKGSDLLYPDYNLCLVSLSKGGGDAVEIREFDVAKKQFVKDGFFIPEAKSEVSWIDKNSIYVGTDFGPGSMTSSGYPRIVKLWKRGTKLKDAETVFSGEVTDVSSSAYVLNTPERAYHFIYRGVTFFTRQVFAFENGKQIKLDIPEDAELNGIFQKMMLISLKRDWQTGGRKYKQGSLLSIGYDDFLKGSRNFSVVAEPSERLSIESASETRDYLIVKVLNNVSSELYRYKWDGTRWNKEKVMAPGFGNISVTTTDGFYSDKYFFSYTGFLSPTSLYYVSDDNKIVKVKSLPEFFDTKDLTVDQFEVPSKDGVKIPYYVIHKKDMKLDGSNPVLQYAYGGFEIPTLPSYSGVTGKVWLERGGVYVVANIRGGGEFGPYWHRSVLKENRQKVFDDMISVSEDLIKRGITSPKHLGIKGGSNGGLLVGAVFTQRPDLYNAVVCQVPLLDMKRYNKLLAGASWMGEYGNPDKPEEWAYIQKYSPYQNLSEAKTYPKVFFMTSTKDDRVHPGHARKMAAKMESMNKPFYYYENTEGGHAAAVTNKQVAFSSALMFSYLWNQLK